MYEAAPRYAASTASTTSGSGRGVSANGGGAAARRVRVLRLLRPRRVAPAFGFSLRGGKEHASGFFITKVELNSEAHHQGLKVGDQLISVNGYRVDDAIHAELTHYIANQTRIKLKVRNVGMVPVKDKSHEPLTWKYVSDNTSLTSDTTTSSSPTLCHDNERLKEIHLSVLVPPNAKLGCGICKGPEWKPGIFVQFVKEHGIARDSGLRPGDQILSCNGLDFKNVQFNEAISAMKQSPRLELRVCPGAGTELVSPESSGYNSSASSAAGGDHSPPTPGNKRLSIVTEENAEFKDRLIQNRLKRRTWDSVDFNWRDAKSHNFDDFGPSDIEPDYDSPSIPNNPHSYENQKNLLQNTSSNSVALRNPKKGFVSNPSNRTIINLTENGATIQCSYEHRAVNKTVSDNTQTRDKDKKTIVVEVHHNKGSKVTASSGVGATVVSKDTCSETSSMSSNTTLSSAISEEIMRRKLKQTLPARPGAPPVPKKHTLLKSVSVDDAKMKQHDALMDEFKKMHRKMFSQELVVEMEGEDLDRQQTLQLHKSTPAVNGHGPTKMAAAAPPPPPPMPLPQSDNACEDAPVTKTNCVIKGIVKEINTFNRSPTSNGTLKRTPTPDYEPASIESLTAKLKLKNGKEETAEVDSIESYKMMNPSSAQPKPPSTYFMRSPNGTATMKKSARPVSMTIGEYPSKSIRKEPSKLEFLNVECKVNNTEEQAPIGSRLQSELALTLSRSNLRKKTELLASKLEKKETTPLVNTNESDTDTNFHKRYGNNILPTPPEVSIPKVPAIKANSHNVTSHIAALANKISLYQTDANQNGLKDQNVIQRDNTRNIDFGNVMMAIEGHSDHRTT